MPVIEVLWKSAQHGAKIFNKTCSEASIVQLSQQKNEASIGLLPSFWSSNQKNACYRSHRDVVPHFNCLNKRMPFIEVLGKSVNMELRYLTKCAVLKLA